MNSDRKKLFSNRELGYVIQEFHKEVHTAGMNQQDIAVVFEKWRDQKLKTFYNVTILTIKAKNCIFEGTIFKYDSENNNFTDGGVLRIERITSENCDILEIQRNDGITFQIGNFIKYYGRFMVIKSFTIQEDHILFVCELDENESGGQREVIAIANQCFKISRDVIFTTYDNKEVRGGDYVWVNNETANFQNNLQRIMPGYQPKAHLLYFKEKENAQAYIFSKRKIFSIDDLWTERGHDVNTTIRRFILSLTKKQKEKENAKNTT